MYGILVGGFDNMDSYLAPIQSLPQREERDKDGFIKERVDQCTADRHAVYHRADIQYSF